MTTDLDTDKYTEWLREGGNGDVADLLEALTARIRDLEALVEEHLCATQDADDDLAQQSAAAYDARQRVKELEAQVTNDTAIAERRIDDAEAERDAFKRNASFALQKRVEGLEAELERVGDELTEAINIRIEAREDAMRERQRAEAAEQRLGDHQPYVRHTGNCYFRWGHECSCGLAALQSSQPEKSFTIESGTKSFQPKKEEA